MNPVENPRDWVAARFVEILGPVLESMADQSPTLAWQPADAPLPDAGGEMLWWAQPLRGITGAMLWVGTPTQTWEHAGTLSLKAAGLETVESSEARNTWIEILNQALSAVARAIGGLVGTEVVCEAGAERLLAREIEEWASVQLTFAGKDLPPLLLGVGAALIAAVASPAPPETPAAAAPVIRDPHAQETPIKSSRTMDLLLKVELPVSISFGKTCLPLRDVLKLTTGSIVELNRTASDPVDVLVNQRLVARGEVVVVEGNYGIRIQQIASRHDRLRSIP
jgi:flagellar motor switch protein FliN/FliY